MTEQIVEISREIYDHRNPERSVKKLEGLNEEVVKAISEEKQEPEWMLSKRLNALRIFLEKPIPKWGPDLSTLDFQKIRYYLKPEERKNMNKWEDVPNYIKKTFEKLGIPEAEKKALAGAGAMYESEVMYHNLKKEWEEKGVIFEDMDIALQKYPELVKKYFMSDCVPINDHKFAALHGAVWSGGTFIYVPKNVKVTLPLQAYFRMNSPRGGQFEHTLIVADEGAEVSYLEGCSSPIYNENSIHAGCVEIFVHKNARVRYHSIENWSRNTFNLNTKRAVVFENGIVEWINANFGSHTTMLYPCSVLKEKGAKSEFIGIAYAGKDQNQDTGHKVLHLASNTSSTVVSKSISKDGGITTYRGLVHIAKGAKNSKCKVQCDALMMDNKSKSNTIPYMDIKEQKVTIGHEASVGKIDEEKLFYLMSRGVKEEDARKLIVSGFVEPISKQLPMEYALEFNRLVELEMETSLG
ncbi:Fe-S cluster assembly protein SufB [Candidatus Woesearchaeota archaeon]|nr:Fe-S cluster assembly protein SufB [Candidatus Woesearchaeota archaeon]